MALSIRRSLLLSATAVAFIGIAAGRAPALAAADDTLGMALMSASVKADGTLHHGSGVVSVTKPAMTSGEYHVKFERSIATCTCVANLGGVDGNGSYFVSWHINANCPPFINATPTDPTLALVATSRDLQSQYNQEDADFHLIVFCPR
jgi:hypothetical protein